MPYFIRRYEKGVKNSGCKDIIVSETNIPIETFINLAHATGPGKYILGQRGKGIRGFNKITDCQVELEEDVTIDNTYGSLEMDSFAAEDSISVKRNLRLSDMSDREISDLMHTMETSDIKSDDEFTKFRKDLSALNRELRSRMTTSNHNVVKTEHNAENAFTGPSVKDMPVASAMFGVSPWTTGAIGVVIGGLAGAIGTSMYYKGKIDNLGSEIDNIGVKLAEAEIAINRAEEHRKKDTAVKAAETEFDRHKFFDAELLRNYQTRNTPQY
jgi:hypothetical protein|tara:strand:- start:2362 stop:3171 length:810 start_codon:yes stop_codon:yes gene_type:complete